MRKRYDYRADYKGWSIDKIKIALPKLKDDLLKRIGICDTSDYMKRISYLEAKLTKHK